jgi:hypothetical protein
MDNDNERPIVNLAHNDFGYVEALPAPSRGHRLPKINFGDFLKKTKNQFLNFKIFSRKRNIDSPPFSTTSSGISFRKKPMFIALVIFVLLLIGAGFFLTQSSKKTPASTQGDKRAQIPDAKARQDISKQYDFPIKDSNGKDVTKIQYSVENAELHDQIVVQGQQATAIKGKTFLVVNLKITNNFDKPIQLNTKDYIRLTRNNNTEQLAADIHNDPVTIQPISTKYTRLGFAINDNDKNLQLHVGEINGEKTTIDINL